SASQVAAIIKQAESAAPYTKRPRKLFSPRRAASRAKKRRSHGLSAEAVAGAGIYLVIKLYDGVQKTSIVHADSRGTRTASMGVLEDCNNNMIVIVNKI
ncbi:MAG: hypothetical protein Q7J84_06085, partial [Sulfuricaulis sp.]|nr:hypothetical protein [Sulfuricaulis sp.]